MNRQDAINDAINLIKEALSNGEIEESYKGCEWGPVIAEIVEIGDLDYTYRAKPVPREWLVTLKHGSIFRAVSGDTDVIKVREVIE